jgi:hypothetical protein
MGVKVLQREFWQNGINSHVPLSFSFGGFFKNHVCGHATKRPFIAVNAGGRGNETMVGWQTMDAGKSWLGGLDWTSIKVGQHALHKVLSPSIILVCQIQEKCFVYTY